MSAFRSHGLGLGRPAARGESRLKRIMDASLAAAGLLIASPVWLLIATAIKLEDGGPVLYTQMRWGRHKKPFRVYKFRSMIADADRKFGAVQAGTQDPRITRVGRLLRRTSLDELPQLLNILRGDMSWVGPRALPINERQVNEAQHVPDDAVPGFEERCRVRPGLTGVAQIFAPRDVPRRQKFRYDAFYIAYQSFRFDLGLILLSLWISVNLRWEDRGQKVARARRRRVIQEAARRLRVPVPEPLEAEPVGAMLDPLSRARS